MRQLVVRLILVAAAAAVAAVLATALVVDLLGERSRVRDGCGRPVRITATASLSTSMYQPYGPPRPSETIGYGTRTYGHGIGRSRFLR